MKKILLIAACAATVFAVSACKNKKAAANETADNGVPAYEVVENAQVDLAGSPLMTRVTS